MFRFPQTTKTNGKGKDGRGIGSHTDYGLLVIAAQDDVGGEVPIESSGFYLTDHFKVYSFDAPSTTRSWRIGRRVLLASKKMMNDGTMCLLYLESSQSSQVCLSFAFQYFKILTSSR
jgi:hypothetical protein